MSSLLKDAPTQSHAHPIFLTKMNFGGSEECAKSELDLFTVPPTQKAMELGEWIHIQPHSNYHEGTIQFDYMGTANQYLNLSETELHITATIRKINPLDNTLSAPIQNTDLIGPVNNFNQSLFSQVEVFLNNAPVENSNSTYAYRAYMENTLCHSKEDKETFLQSDMYYQDDAEQMENFEPCITPQIIRIKENSNPSEVEVIPEVSGNNGYMRRRNRCLNTSVQMMGRLHGDIFNMNKYLLGDVNLTIKLTRSRPEFCLCGQPGRYIIYIDRALLKIRRTTINPSVLHSHAMALEKSPARYPIKRVVVKPFTIPALTTKAFLPGVHKGLMPQRIVLGFIDTEAFNGSFNKNPFNFKNYGVTQLLIKIDSRALPYNSGLEFDFDKKRYIDGYNSLFQGIRQASNNISYDDYAAGYTFYAFDLTPDLSNRENFSILQDGSLDIDISFSETPEKSITAICYLEFDNVILINKDRVVSFDYQV